MRTSASKEVLDVPRTFQVVAIANIAPDGAWGRRRARGRHGSSRGPDVRIRGNWPHRHGRSAGSRLRTDLSRSEGTSPRARARPALPDDSPGEGRPNDSGRARLRVRQPEPDYPAESRRSALGG